MYRRAPVITESEGSNDSKYKVAEILTSMPSTVVLQSSVFDPLVAVTSAPPLFTPITTVDIEQSFKKRTNSITSAAASKESGFVPPVVSQMPVMVQVKSEVDYDTDYSSVSSEHEFGASPSKRARYDKSKLAIPEIDPQTYLVANSRRPTGPRKLKRDDKLTPEEEEKRQQRRERNKQAAAKCRRRREDVTNTLIVETENLEEEKNKLENEIFKLCQQKEQFEFVLQSHRNSCQHPSLKEPSRRQFYSMAAPQTTATMTSFPATVTSTASTHLPARPHHLVSTARGLATPGVAATGRPTSLDIVAAARTAAVTEAIGIPISTPSTGVFGFETMAEGHTGLTPLTGFASSSIAGTPAATAPNNASCSGQVQNLKRRSTDSSSSNELASPTTLIAL